jgi:pyruvate formate lyase activating enzyme
MKELMEARYWRTLPNKKVQCQLCPHFCVVAGGAQGKCRSRINLEGKLYTKNYGKTISLSMDPIEKKPLYHYYPGTEILSLGPNTCNLSCAFCQNYEISQYEVDTMYLSPMQLKERVNAMGIKQVAFTYTEPLMWFEYIMDCAPLFREENIRMVMVSNGFINPEPLQELLPHIDAWNIDLKSMDDEFYTKICGAHLQPVLETITAVAKTAHLEITNLLIPNQNDRSHQIERLVNWIEKLNPEIPLHFSRYFPRYQMKEPSTPVSTLEKAYTIAIKKLHYVYIGNVDHHTSFDTKCWNCKSLLIERIGYTTKQKGLEGDKCRSCGTKIYGRFV